MQSLKRTILYGIAIWVLLVVVSLLLFSLEQRDDTLFESIKFLALVSIVSGFTVAYLSKVKQSSLIEGLTVGFIWLAITVLLDLVLYAFNLFNLKLFDYFKDVASSYLVMPILAGLMMHYLRRKEKV